MHHKYVKDGLVAVSVSLDDPSEAKNKEAVLKFLRAKKATFDNFILNEQPEAWQEKLKIDGPPCVFVFNRAGEVAKKFSAEVDYKEIEKLVQELLPKK